MESIPKITPGEPLVSDKDVYNVKSAVDPSQKRQETVLIPKINMEENSANLNSTISNTPATPMSRSKSRSKLLRILLPGMLVLVVLLLVFGFLSWGVYKSALSVKDHATKVKDSLIQKDLNLTSDELGKFKTSIEDLNKSYSRLVFIKPIPFIGSYYRDGTHMINAVLDGVDAGGILLDSVKPYADIIGFKSDGGANPAIRTAQDKIDFVIKTVPEIVPKIDELSEKVNLVNQELSGIDPNRYPQNVKGFALRQNMVSAFELLDSVDHLISEGKPLLSKSDYFLGVESPRTYMIIFQNDKELRPTGGFITAYSIARVDRGRFIPVTSSDIYDLDNRYQPTIKAPDQFPKYLKGIYVALNRFRLRDMNWNPDFEQSMNVFSQEIKKAGISDIDGIIAVDTQMLVNLLEVLGKVNVPGYGDYSADITPECKCPQVIYELESFADTEGAIVWSENEPGKIVYAPPNYDDRKKIIGPLMNSILSATLGQPDNRFPLLFEAAVKSFTEKHVLFYLFDKDAEDAVKAFGVGGNIKDYGGGDYLYINDANLGGRKSNLYVTQEVTQEVASKGDRLEKTLTITYKNPEKQDGWLNSVLPNWIRIYVPKGSEVLEKDGFEEFVDPYEESGKTVFAGFVSIRPQGVAKVSVKYSVPVNSGKEYRLFIQKQPGKDAPLYSISFGRKNKEFALKTDQEIRL